MGNGLAKTKWHEAPPKTHSTFQIRSAFCFCLLHFSSWDSLGVGRVALHSSPNFLQDGLRRTDTPLQCCSLASASVYAEVVDVKKLREKYGVLSDSELRGSKEFYVDVLDQDLRMTVKLQILYGRLIIGSLRSAFEESAGNLLRKFGSSENKDLLKRFMDR